MLSDDIAHVVPIGDLMAHQADDDCPCGPVTSPVFRGDGSNGWVVVHSILDGREATEPDGGTRGNPGRDGRDV